MSKKQPKLTPWFSGDVKPARDGVYQRNYNDGVGKDYPVYAKYSEGYWFVFGSTPYSASSQDCESSNVTPWRGLAAKS